MSGEGATGGSTKEAGLAMRLLTAPLVAISFLTVLPVPQPRSVAGSSMGWAVACFPIAGAILGLGLAGLDRLLTGWFPPAVGSALLLAALLAATGALHLDGLMDSFDGVFGGKDRESRLSIMKDSRVGSFGIAAAVTVLLMEYGSLTSLAPGVRGEALVLAVALARWAMAATLWLFPAAGSTGLAAGLKPQVRWIHAAVGTILAAGIALALAGWAGAVLLALSALAALLTGRYIVGRLGGITGDSCGAVGTLVETIVLVVSVAVVG